MSNVNGAVVDTHSRGYGGYSPRRSHAPPYPPARRPPPDPHTFDYPASLKQFAEWFRYFYPREAQDEDSADKAAEQKAEDGIKPRNGIKARWEKYKKEFAANQVSNSFSFVFNGLFRVTRPVVLKCFLMCIVAASDVRPSQKVALVCREV